MEKEKYYWDREEEHEAIMGFSDDYMAFLDRAKTERMAAKEIVRLAEEAGYKDFYAVDQLKRGDKIYFLNKEKSVVLFDLAGDLEEGMAIVASHIDSPRLDIKATPLYEEENVALLKTHYYGGIKKYQWTAIPLAIHGVVIT
ncbi:MAG: aminopeptidase, partial [Aedoeadaptatus pacaensis]